MPPRSKTTLIPEEIARWLDVLASVPAGKSLVDQALNHGIRFRLAPKSWQYAYYQQDGGIIGIKPNRPENEIIGNLAHELRHAFQDKTGQMTSLTDSPRDVLLRTHSTEADAESLALLVCAQLAEAGHPEYLQARLDGEMPDIARRFVATLPQGPLPAMRAAYDQWFEDEGRRTSYFSYAIDWMDINIRERAKAQVTSGPLPYTRKDIVRLGLLPGGLNYLSATGGPALDSPFYCRPITPSQEESLQDAQMSLDHLRKTFNSRSRSHPNKKPKPGKG
ncbi:MAG TPA: hypothetical protein DCW68_06580 [Rhodospirillaceae bacterium]|nr:MAG: hypothetical protein A2018_01090 [Alphaproteobacteria bacterium GWF2_58_20]HAU29753.1 hypothetical protein [Rhodospirillaceae bacterium]